jgi:8-oxo-dGTP pyrophosphatase MutT (NUDIX family)
LVEVAELDFVLAPAPWPFARSHAASIAAHWAELRSAKPAIYNGRVLLMGRRELTQRDDGDLRLRGTFFEADYADFVAWRAFGHPGDRVDNCFAMVALRGSDGAFLLGEMAPHTLNSGQIYFPAGTPDPDDVFDGRVDLDASAERELLEETGIATGETAIRPGWTVVFAAERIACMKLMTLPASADEARTRIEAFLSLDPHAEFSRMHIVRNPGDINEERTPDFVAAYLRAALA